MVHKRQRDPLEPNQRDSLNKRHQIKNDHYLVNRAVSESVASHAARQRRSIVAVHSRSCKREKSSGSLSAPCIGGSSAARQREHGRSIMPGMTKSKKSAIYFAFKNVYGSPPQDQWGEYQIVNAILCDLKLQPNQYGYVKNTLISILDGSFTEAVEKQKPKSIQRGSDDEYHLCELAEQGLSILMCTVMLNKSRAERGESAVCWSTVQRFFKTSDLVVRERRQTGPMGSTNESSDWSKARLSFAIQWLEGLQSGDRLRDSVMTTRNVVGQDIMVLDQILFVDEKRVWCKLGHPSPYEIRVYRGVDGRPLPKKDGGTLPNRAVTRLPKYGCGCDHVYGLAMVKLTNGKLAARRMTPFEYTGTTVIGPARFRDEVDSEMVRVKSLGGVWGRKGAGYEERYGERAFNEAVNVVSKKYTSIITIIDHVIGQGNLIFWNTRYQNTWRLYHDALSAWWSGEAQDYIRQIGFATRQIRLLDEGVASRYEGGMVGNSPELNPLDSHCFSDLEQMLDQHVALTWRLPPDDPRKFCRGTPAEAARSAMMLWEILPEQRIIMDITAIPRSLALIIQAKGCAVDTINNRTGRRAAPRGTTSASGNHVKRMPVPRQSKKTMTSKNIHPLCQDVYDDLAVGAE